MDNQINTFLQILRDNNYESKEYSNPDEIELDPFDIEDILVEIDIEKMSEEIGFKFFELNGFSTYDDLKDYLNNQLNEFKIAFIANEFTKDKRLKDEIIQQVSIIKKEIMELIQFPFFIDASLLARFGLKVRICNEVISFINNQENRIKPRRLKDTENPNRLIQKEVVILFYHLKKTGLIGKNIPNNVYAQYISDLTGYEAEKIRQDLSNINSKSDSLDRQRFSSTDFSGIKRKIEKLLIPSIIEDNKEKFPPEI